MRRQIELSNLIAAVERAVIDSYDDELARHETMKRFSWAAMVLGSLVVVLTIIGVATYNVVAAVFAVIAGIAWLVSRAEWEATRTQIGMLERALADQKLYIGGRGRDVYLTTDPYDNAWGDAMGEWLRSPLPQSSDKLDSK